MLRAIGEGAGTLDEIRDTFEIHPRLLIEALVTLTQAGWLAVSGTPGKSFVVTPEGQQAILSGDNPESLQIWDDDAHVIMERMSGGIILGEDIRPERTDHLKEKSSGMIAFRWPHVLRTTLMRVASIR